MCVQLLSLNPWTVAHQPPLSTGFPRQEEYWSGLPFPSPGDLTNPGVKPASPVSPALQAGSLPTQPLVVSGLTDRDYKLVIVFLCVI